MKRFILGDCMDPEHGLPSYPDNLFGLAIVDPQYGIGASKPSKKPCRVLQKNGKYLNVKNSNYAPKDWDFELMPDKYFKELHRVSKRVILWGANYQTYPLRGGRLIWDKLNGGSDQYDAEIAYLSWTNRVETVYYMWSGMFQGKYPNRDVRIAYRQRGNKKTNEKRIHPTQKPIDLLQRLIEIFTDPGDVVIYPVAGSGSTLVAATLSKRPSYGFEIKKPFHKEGKAWIEKVRLREEEIDMYGFAKTEVSAIHPTLF